ncbi:MAG TPA: PfkB family carbohydrate kinase, partial [Candidatus Acidoferrales bacterium]|nr:PfkB family carbohydrate kinase [Candidatus Acidoferrales bacterium]
MNNTTLSVERVRRLLTAGNRARILVIGDVMLDHFIWGGVSRISPEAPVPVVEFERESFMPGGAANVARNLAALNVFTEVFGMIGRDENGRRLKDLLSGQKIRCGGLLTNAARPTSVKTRIVAHQQQVVRIDRETRDGLNARLTGHLLAEIKTRLPKVDAVIV